MKIYELFGVIILIIKFFIPLLIIMYGTLDIFQIIIKPKEKVPNNKIKIFMLRIIAGIIIFFMPTIIVTIFDKAGLDKKDYSCAYNCVFDIKQCNPIITE